jgi:CheY-like chemotaxis protein
MMKTPKYHFIVIDDSRLDCLIAEKVIQNSHRHLSVTSYYNALDALDFIGKSSRSADAKTILIVDIQMPLMNGFEFIEAFEQLSEEIQENYVVNVLTSSTNRSDINRIQSYRSVKSQLNKPLTPQAFADILKDEDDER